MGILDFKGRAQAEAWKRDFNDLNERTEQILGQVHLCIDEIKAESSGDFVDQLVITAGAMAEAADSMIHAMKAINNVIDDILSKLAEVITEAVQDVVDSRRTATNM